MELIGSGRAKIRDERLDATFMALADPTRRAILSRLTRGEASVLERAGLISRGRDAQRRPCRIEGKALGEAAAYLERYRDLWELNFKRLDSVLAEITAKPEKRTPAKRRRS